MQLIIEIPDEKAPFFMELMEHLEFKAIVMERETETEDHPKVSNRKGAEG